MRLTQGVILPCTPLPSRKNDLPPIFSLAKNRIVMDTQQYSLNIYLKEELTDLFWKFPGIHYSHRHSRKGMVNTVLMVNINHICNK